MHKNRHLRDNILIGGKRQFTSSTNKGEKVNTALKEKDGHRIHAEMLKKTQN